MRYRETGQVHMDFHRTMNATICYLRKKYGEKFLDETFKSTAREVYRSIRQDMQRGDSKKLVEHWRYFFDREGGDYTIEHEGNDIRMTVNRCPAITYLQGKGIEIDPAFCRQTIVINAALAENTSFQIHTEVLGNGRCIQTIRRKS